jgi:hypothetical protein
LLCNSLGLVFFDAPRSKQQSINLGGTIKGRYPAPYRLIAGVEGIERS